MGFPNSPTNPTASWLSRTSLDVASFLVPFAEAPKVPCSVGLMSATDSRRSCVAATSSLTVDAAAWPRRRR